jgi:hypothetical protein
VGWTKGAFGLRHRQSHVLQMQNSSHPQRWVPPQIVPPVHTPPMHISWPQY